MIQVLGGRVLGLSIDAVAHDRIFPGHLSVRSPGGVVQLEVRPQDSISLLPDAHAPIFARPEVLDAAAVSIGDLKSAREMNRARSISRAAAPTPILKI